MIDFDLFLPDLYAECEGVPESLALSRVRDAAIYFCAQSEWVQEYRTLTITPGTVTYTVAPSNTTHERITSIGKHVLMNNATTKDVFRVARRDYDEIAVEFPDATVTGVPQVVVREAEAREVWRLRFYPAPANSFTGYQCFVQIILTPKRDATQVDDEIYEEWKEPVIHKAASTLMAMPNKKWSNSNVALFHKNECERLIRDARFRREEGRHDRGGEVAFIPERSLRGGFYRRGSRGSRRWG